MSKYSKAQEYRVAKFLNKRGWDTERVPNSGNARGSRFKGDVVGQTPSGEPVYIDHKSTRGKESITIHRQDLIEVNGQENGFLTFNFMGQHKIYAIVELEKLCELME